MKKISKKIWIIIIIIVLILLLGFAVYIRQEMEKKKIEDYTSITEFNNVKEIVEYMKCTYLSEQKSKTEGYDLDIYLEFCYTLEKEEDYNEVFFNQVINNLTYVTRYQNIRLLDEKNKITIEIMCEQQKIKQIKINGQENYFEKIRYQDSIQTYTPASYTNFSIQSKELAECLQNNWVRSKVELGTKESSIDNYDIYFDEGIKVKEIQYRIYNLIFTNRYQGQVVNGIKVGDSLESVVQKLGNPSLGDIQSQKIGYIGENFYLFCTPSTMIIYRVDRKEKTKDFEKLVTEYIKDNDEKKLMNALTDLWKDYASYQYSENYFKIVYPTKGVEISYNVGDFNGITFYQNYAGKIIENKTYQQIVEEKIELPENIQLKTKGDIIEEQELGRMRTSESYYVEEEGKYWSKKFVLIDTGKKVSGNSNIKIISQDGNYPDSEFAEEIKIKSYLWMDDENLLYSIENNGIYLYNATSRVTSSLIKGQETYELKEFQDSILTYDEKKIKIQY